MNEIPIFDSLTHPTLSGDWILPKYPQCATLDSLRESMNQNGVKWAFAVGMENIGAYEEEAFLKLIKSHLRPVLLPVAFFSPAGGSVEIGKKLEKIKKLGYAGIKLHPRISNFLPGRDIAGVVRKAASHGLTVLMCTYPYGAGSAGKMTPEVIMEFLECLDSAKIILLHAGAVRLLEFMEITRAFPNVLLDLSLSLCKYPGSSLDFDLEFMFRNFDRRICIGSDFPEFNQKQLRERFQQFGRDLPIEKLENVAFRNLINFCGLEDFV